MERKEPKVVAIDDNPDNLVAVKAFVTDAFPGARVFTALNGEKGIDLVREHDPDVILLDIVMPGMDGFEVCRLIKQDPRVRHIPVVFLTALRGDRKSRIKALEVGGEAFISKPFEEAEFIAQVRAMVKIKEANERERDEKRHLASLVEERTAQLEKELAERKATEVALSKSEGRYRAIYDQSPIGIELYDSTGALIHVNPACLNLLGVDNMEVLLGLSLFADPNLNDEYKAKLRQRETIRFQGPFDFDKVKTLNLYPTRREGIIWLDVLITPLGDTAEPVTGYLVQIQDVSVRKGVEDALRDSEERYRAIADFTYDWEYWRAPDGKFIYNSPSCERITGYSPEEFDLDPNLLITITHPDDRDIVIDHLSLGMSSSREHGILEFRIINRNGEEQWIGHECQPIYNTNGEYLGHRGSNRDITQRKRADDALRESEERYHALFSHNTSVSLLIDPETGRIVDANPAACNYYGYSHEQLIRRGIYDLNRKEREKVIKNLLYARSGGSKHFSTTHYLANGEERNVEIYSGPITIEGKSLFYSIIHDITDRRRAEEELEETRHFIEHIIAITPTLIYIFDIAEQRNIYTNREIFEALGYTSENIAAMGRSLFASILHPDDGERVAHHHALFSTLKEGTVAEIEYRMQHADGHWCWLHSWDVAFFLNPDGSVKQVLGVAIDITDQKVSEEALRESEKKYRQLVDLAQEGIWAIDADGMTTYVNPRMAEMLGYTGEEMQGAHLFSFMDEAGKAIAAEAMERRRQGIKEVHVFEFITKRGDRIYTALSTGPITDEKGTYSGALAVVSDITDRKRAEEELARKHEELNAAYEQLAASEEELRANYEELATSQRSLRETTNYLNNLFDYANAPIITWDPEYVITRFNHAFEDLTLRSGQEVIGQRLDILFPKESRDASFLQIKKTLEGERWETVEIPILVKDGSVRTVLWNSANIISPDGRIISTIAQGVDITERKQAELELMSAQEKLKEAHRLAHIGTWEWVMKTDTATWSEELCNIAGIDPSQPAPSYSEHSRIYSPASWDRLSSGVTIALTTGEPYNLELELVRSDGIIRWTQAFGGVKRDSNGTIIGLHGTVQDITERKHMEESLRESEGRVRKKLDSLLSPESDIGTLDLADIIDVDAIQSLMEDFHSIIHIPSAIIDLHGNVLVAMGWQDICTKFHRVNPETCANCVESDNLLSERVAPGTFKIYRCKNNMWDVVTPITVGGIHLGNLFLGQFLFEDESIDYELFRSQAARYGFDEVAYLAALDRVPRWNREIIDMVMAFYTKFALMIATLSHSNITLARTVTERDTILASLLRINQKLNVISQLTRKDLTNQIFVLKSYLELTKNHAAGQDQIFQSIVKSETAARSISEVIEITRDYQDMGAYPPKWQNVKVALLFGLSHISTGDLQHSLETENLEIFADPLLEKACQGLFENSLAHGDHVTRVRVWHTVTPEGVTIVFEDDGIGIPHEKKEQIFQYADNVHAGARGLYFVRDILDITGITIHETGEPGKGARFEMKVPNRCYRMKQENSV